MKEINYEINMEDFVISSNDISEEYGAVESRLDNFRHKEHLKYIGSQKSALDKKVI